MKTVFSGIQPTGALHLGNYLGAIKPWKELVLKEPQNKFLFCIVDMHAITVFQNPAELKKSIITTFAAYLACGIKGEDVTIFQQSAVPQHAELGWLLSCNTPLGWLDRMTQYKDKTKENKERECLGLYAYPCLMAADILLYGTSLVPVGEDQKQHIELTRDIALRMNKLYGQELFSMPEVKISAAKRVMSLKDGSKKMSKSDPSDFSRINLTDGADEIYRKILKATTGEISSPELLNLGVIYKEVTGKTYDFYEGMQFSAFKKELADALVAQIAPIGVEIIRLLKDEAALWGELEIMSKKTEEMAEKNMREIRKVIGF